VQAVRPFGIERADVHTGRCYGRNGDLIGQAVHLARSAQRPCQGSFVHLEPSPPVEGGSVPCRSRGATQPEGITPSIERTGSYGDGVIAA
jgi:hypothetical protein